MSASKLELFLHRSGYRPTVVNAESTETLRALLGRLDVKPEGVDHPFVFVGERDDAIKVSEGSAIPSSFL